MSATRVFVRGLSIQAQIGIHPHELGADQALVIDVELELEGGHWRGLGDTVDYERIAHHAEAIAGAGHISLVETFAHRLAVACLDEPKVTRARVRVEKPGALAPRAAAAGVEIVLERG